MTDQPVGSLPESAGAYSLGSFVPFVNGGEEAIASPVTPRLTSKEEMKQKPGMLDFDPARAAAKPKDAATVLVLRGGRASAPLEIFCVERHPKSGFLGGAVVFPGGKIDVSDALPSWEQATTSPPPRSDSFQSESADARALGIAACRELLEEGAILPVTKGMLDSEGALSLRAAVREGATLFDELVRQSLVLDIARLVPFARWVTPEAESRRFDARFYLLTLPEGQEGHHDDHETTTSFWATPAHVLARFSEGEIMLAPPTTRALELLSQTVTIDEALALAQMQSLLPICPLFVPDDEAPILALPGDPLHSIAEPRVTGPTRFVMRNGKFVSESAS